MTDEESWSAHRLLILRGIERIETNIKENQKETVSQITQASNEAEAAHTRLRHDFEAGEARSSAQNQILAASISEIRQTLATIQAERRIEKEQIASRSTYLSIGIGVALNGLWEIIRGWAHRT